MDLYSKLRKNNRIFLQATGVSIVKFEEILQKIQPSWDRLAQKKKVSGRPYALPNLASQLLGVLMYYRVHTSYEFLAVHLDISGPTLYRCVKRLSPILKSVIGLKKENKLSPDKLHLLILDCTEQATQRPGKYQKRYYSGKKKQHTLKTELHMDLKGRIVSLSKPHAGSYHDYEIRKRSDQLPNKATVVADSGYQGLQKVHEKTHIPVKKPEKGRLNRSEKIYNRELASIRIRIEHKIRELKIFQVLAQKYRLNRKNYAMIFGIIAGIVNLKNGF